MEPEHLAKIAQHDSAIESLNKGQEKLSSDIHNLEAKLDTGISRISGKLDTINASNRPDVKGVLMAITTAVGVLMAVITAMLTTVGVMMACVGLFVKLTVDPVKRDNIAITEKIDKVRMEARDHRERSAEERGYNRAREKHVDDLFKRDAKERRMLREHVQAIDREGTRRLIERGHLHPKE